MANKGTIEEKDIVKDGSVYDIGIKFAKSLDVADKSIDALKKKWVKSVEEMRKGALKLNSLEGQLKAVTSNKQLVQAQRERIKALKDLEQAKQAEQRTLIQIHKVEQEVLKEKKLALDIANKEVTLIEKKERALKRKTQLTALERFDLQRINKGKREAALLSSKLSTEYEKQSLILTRLRVKYKDVALKQGEGSKEAKKLRTQILRLDSALKKVDANVGQFQRSVGNYEKALKSAGITVGNLFTQLGVTSGLALFVGVMRDAFNRVREFDKSMQNLAGVFRTTRKEIKLLEEEIISVAGESIKTSREVADLAESLATLGKTPEQIQKLLKATVDLGIGLEATGEEAGEFLIQMLNAFGASDDEALKYADTIATIRTSTTLDFQKMRDSFQYIAPISKILNKDLAYTGAVVGILADNSLKAEQAGRLLGTAQQKLAKEGKSLTDALDEINEAKKRGVKETELLAIASKLFGSQAAKVGVILADNTDKIEVNAQAIRDNGGALDDLVKQQLESLDAKLKILDSSWEKFILTIENGKGSIASAYKGLIDSITLAIQYTTDLEKAQSKVFEITGKGKGFFDYFKKINLFSSFIKTDYEELIDLQRDFEKTNKNIDTNGLEILTDMYARLSDKITKNKDLSESEINLYKNQLSVIQKAIDKKRDYRKTLEDQAIALGFNEKELGKYADKIEQYTDRDLANFIKANKKATKTIKEETEAEKQARLEKEQTNKVLQARLKLLKDDQFNFNKAFAESEAEAEKQAYQNTKNSYSKRLTALNQHFNAKQAIIDLEVARERELYKDRADKLEEIELKYEDNSIALKAQKQKESLELLKLYFNTELKQIQEAKKLKEQALNEKIQEQQGILQNSNKTAKDVEKYEKEVAKIKKKYAIDSVNAQIAEITKLIANEKFSKEQIEQLEEQKKLLKLEASNIATNGIIENLEKQKEKEEKLKEFKEKLFQYSSNVLAETLNIDASNLNSFFNDMSDLFTQLGEDGKASAETILGAMASTASVVRDVISATYQANIEELQYQKEQSQAYYEQEIQLAEGNQLKQDLLREEKIKKEREYDKQVKEEKTKQAKADKKWAIIQASIHTAVAITKALPNIFLAALAGALGIVQIGLIASKPIPKFKDGVRNFTGGLAILGDGGVNEFARTPDGKIHKTPKKDTLYNLPKGTDVFKNEKELKKEVGYDEILRASILSNVHLQKEKVDNHKQATTVVNVNLDALLTETKALRKEVRRSANKPTPNVTREIESVINEKFSTRWE